MLSRRLQRAHHSTEMVQGYVTNESLSSKFATLAPSELGTTPSGAPTTITITTSTTKQSIQGFGAALTEASVANLMAMSSTDRSSLMQELFSPDPTIAAGISFVRVPMGATDMSVEPFWTYDDMPTGQTDPTLAQFSIARDQAALIPLLLQAKAINPNLTLLATPWSPPAWMKSNDSLTGGGTVDAQYYDAWASYFVKFLQAYSAAGLTIDYLSIQNEMGNSTQYPSMVMWDGDARTFIAQHLSPQLQSAGFAPKILVWDWNWDNTSQPLVYLDDAAVKPLISGSAFHNYNDSAQPTNLTTVHNAHPDKEIHMTESTAGTWTANPPTSMDYMVGVTLLEVLRNWSRSVLYFNMVLDENNGPAWASYNYGLVHIDSQSGNITQRRKELYALRHANHAFSPGATIVDSSETTNILSVAGLNSDGTMGLLLYNTSIATQSIDVTVDGSTFNTVLDSKMVASYRW